MSCLCLCELRGLGIISREMKPTEMNNLHGQRSILFWGDKLLFELPLYTSPLKAKDLELAHRTPLISCQRNFAFVWHQEVSFVIQSRFCNLASYSKIKMQHVFWIYGIRHFFYVLKMAHHFSCEAPLFTAEVLVIAPASQEYKGCITHKDFCIILFCEWEFARIYV